jgi:hypothetical protein
VEATRKGIKELTEQMRTIDDQGSSFLSHAVALVRTLGEVEVRPKKVSDDPRISNHRAEFESAD